MQAAESLLCIAAHAIEIEDDPQVQRLKDELARESEEKQKIARELEAEKLAHELEAEKSARASEEKQKLARQLENEKLARELVEKEKLEEETRLMGELEKRDNRIRELMRELETRK